VRCRSGADPESTGRRLLCVVWGRGQRRRSKLATESRNRVRVGTARSEEEDLETAGDRSVPGRETRTQRSLPGSTAGLVRDPSKRDNAIAEKTPKTAQNAASGGARPKTRPPTGSISMRFRSSKTSKNRGPEVRVPK